MTHQPIRIEQLYNAPVDKVWQALTDKNQMKEWYFDLEAFQPKVGCTFRFTGGVEDREDMHICKVTEVIVGQKLRYSWQYEVHEDISCVTFGFFPDGHKTRLVLTL